MMTPVDLSPIALSTTGVAEPSPTETPSWRLTRSIHTLRLTIADASLRAREEAQRYNRALPEHWISLGRARGYHEAAMTLRSWTHPDVHTSVLAALERQAQRAEQHQIDDTASNLAPATIRAYHNARAWALRWVLTQVSELSAHAIAMS